METLIFNLSTTAKELLLQLFTTSSNADHSSTLCPTRHSRTVTTLTELYLSSMDVLSYSLLQKCTDSATTPRSPQMTPTRSIAVPELWFKETSQPLTVRSEDPQPKKFSAICSSSQKHNQWPTTQLAWRSSLSMWQSMEMEHSPTRIYSSSMSIRLSATLSL